jgi:hypothetical protein
MLASPGFLQRLLRGLASLSHSQNSCTIPYATQTITPDGYTYDAICGVDFIGQNIYPFLLTSSFEACMEQCDLVSQSDGDGVTQCVGFVYAPERSHDVDDCYLKSALNSAVPATISLLGATRTQVSTMALAKATSEFTIASSWGRLTDWFQVLFRLSPLRRYCHLQRLRQPVSPRS